MSTTDPSHLSPNNAERYKHFMKEGKDLAASGMLIEALEALRKAAEICRSEKVSTRIKKLEQFIKEHAEDVEENEAGEETIEVAPGFFLYHEIYEKLFSYQRRGVAWMYELFTKKKGGVLGDDMGLGKTFQVIAFLSGMIDANLIKHILIVMPVSLLPNWKKEFADKCPGIVVYDFHGTSKKQREQNVVKVQRRGGVLLTSYGMVLANAGILNSFEGRCFVWDYVILDEGHKIKNPTKTTKAVHELPARHRLVMTGTPLQNKLVELWALYNFAHQGALLGSLKTFKMHYEAPITRSREKDATLGERKLGTEIAENLKHLISPYFLRRTKDEVFKMKNKEREAGDAVDELNEEFKNMELSMKTRKNDFIIWLFLSNTQHEIYTSFLETDSVKQIFVTKRSPLVELNVLKKICDHPRLLSIRACMQLGLNGEMSQEEMLREIEDERAATASIENVSDDDLINESGKMKFAIQLLEHLKVTGHRMLVFSLSRKILDMIQRILTHRGWKVLRIDGTISKMEERQKRIDLFQNNSSFPVFLLTTQVGGVGLTLTAADRVIIYDPSWNPATDAQAVDRVYRIGQTNNVVIYRLITCGTVEEKIYRNQVFKDSITRQTTSQAKDPHRYFSKQELRELFAVEDIYHSNTQEQLSRMHSNERVTDTSLDEHIAYIHTLNIFGISDHNLMFSKEVKDPSADNDEASVSHDYIKRRVEMARMMVQTESSVIEEGMRQAGSFVKPFTIPISSAKKLPKPDGYKVSQFPEIIDLTQPKFSTGAPSVPNYRNGSDSDVAVISPPNAYGQFKHSNSRTYQRNVSSGNDSISPGAVPSKCRSPQSNVSSSSGRRKIISTTRSPEREPVITGRKMQSLKSPRKSLSRNPSTPSPNKQSDVVNRESLNSFRGSSSGVTSPTTIFPNARKDPKGSIIAEDRNSSFGSKNSFTKLNASPNEGPSFAKSSNRSPTSDNETEQKLDSPIQTNIAQHTSSPLSNAKPLSSHEEGPSNLTLPSDESLVNWGITENRPISTPSNILMKTRLFDDSLDFSDPERFSVNRRLSKRKSCVNRRTTMLLSESDSSKSTCQSVNTSNEIVVADSHDENSDEDASSVIIDDSFQDSISPKGSFAKQEINPSAGDFITPCDNKTVFNKVSSDSTKKYGSLSRRFPISTDKINSPKRITPIRLDPARPSPSNTAFEKAVVASKELSPLIETKVKTSASKTQPPTCSKNLSVHSDIDSPIAVSARKKGLRKIVSESSDNDSDQKISMSERSKARQRRSKEPGNDLEKILSKLNFDQSLRQKMVAPQTKNIASIKPLRFGKQRQKIVELEQDTDSDLSERGKLTTKRCISGNTTMNQSAVKSAEDASDDGSNSDDLSDDGSNSDDLSDGGSNSDDLSDGGSNVDDLIDDGSNKDDLSDDGSNKDDLNIKKGVTKQKHKKTSVLESDGDLSDDESNKEQTTDSDSDLHESDEANVRKLLSKRDKKHISRKTNEEMFHTSYDEDGDASEDESDDNVSGRSDEEWNTEKRVSQKKNKEETFHTSDDDDASEDKSDGTVSGQSDEEWNTEKHVSRKRNMEETFHTSDDLTNEESYLENESEVGTPKTTSKSKKR